MKQQKRQGLSDGENLSALLMNAQAITVVAQAVEGTLGPQGLDTMLLDQFGEVMITNDGVTILTMMDVTHPAAKMLINLAKAQQKEVGDGTTTATILAATLVNEGVRQIGKGVPVVKVIEGITVGLKMVLHALREKAIPLTIENHALLLSTAKVAARGNEDIAILLDEAITFFQQEKIAEPTFKLADHILAVEGAENQVIAGMIINKKPLNEGMPQGLKRVKVLLLEDALEPEKVENTALGTEAGFARYLELQQEFKQNVEKIKQLGVGLVLVGRGVHDLAEEILTDAGVLVLSRVSLRELRQVVRFCGGRLLKGISLKKGETDLGVALGEVAEVVIDRKLRQTRLLGGQGETQATILVGAATEEVVQERGRIAQDAASAVQAACQGGVVPGGGIVELAIMRELVARREEVKGMAVYGFDCVCEALKKPFSQIIENAGFNALEKLGLVLSVQREQGNSSLGINCASGEIIDIEKSGIYDPVLVKTMAWQTAGEVATAILRIATILKKKEQDSANSFREENR